MPIYILSKKILAISLEYDIMKSVEWRYSSAGMSVRLTRERSRVRAPLSPLGSQKGTFFIKILDLGGVAQLGERRVRNAKAEGSNPFVSTKIRIQTCVFCLCVIKKQ